MNCLKIILKVKFYFQSLKFRSCAHFDIFSARGSTMSLREALRAEFERLKANKIPPEAYAELRERTDAGLGTVDAIVEDLAAIKGRP
jgi:hypothetical protein